jgi:ribonucleoside-diphosphate reductase alpha chain
MIRVKSPDKVQERRSSALTQMITNQQDAPTCPNCGNVVVRNGACYKCLNCGESLGCS